MKDMKYIIETRYEHWTSTGKVFTQWFALSYDEYTEAEAKEYIERVSKDYAHIDKITKCKHEYRIRNVEEVKQEMEEIQRSIAESRARDKAYFASDEWKELKHKKYVARKELKKHQEEYNKMMEGLKND